MSDKGLVSEVYNEFLQLSNKMTNSPTQKQKKDLNNASQIKNASSVISTKKMWYTYTMEYYPAIKNNEFVSFVGTSVNLEAIILCKLTQE